MSRWPALMNRKTAAEYVEVHPDTFSKEVACGRMPSPVLFGGRDHWRRADIDQAIRRLGGGSNSTDDIRARMMERLNAAAA